MTPRSGAQPAALALAMALATSGARADAWDPGRRVTSPVAGQVAPRDGRVSDGAYGRFEGDVDLGFGVGPEFDGDSTRAHLRASAHYFSMIGIAGAFAEDVASDTPRLSRLVSIELDLRPAFLPRFANDMQQGPGVLDLTLDSISLGLGVYWATPADQAFGDERGFELSAGLAVPLIGRASGPFLEARGLWRHPDSGVPPRAAGVILLSWHGLLSTPLTSRGE